MRRRIFTLWNLSVVLCVAVATGMGTARTAAAQDWTVIRDAESEDIIAGYAAPILEAAGFAPDQVTIRLINDDRLNAFAAPGLRMFFFTGLVIRAETANQVIGVIAHEAGHLAGGHINRRFQTARDLTTQGILATVLGGLTAVATGRPDLGFAVAMGGMDATARSFLAYSRSEEQAADQAAVQYLDATGQPSRGLRDFFEVLAQQELLVASRMDPYLSTHPQVRGRLDFIRRHAAESAHGDAALDPDQEARHERLRAKLAAFLQPAPRVLERYPAEDTRFAARYGRGIALTRVGRFDEGIAILTDLLGAHPDDAFLNELIGELLFENQRVAAAMPYYDRAIALRPDSPLIRIAAAQVQVEMGTPDALAAATANLRAALAREREIPFAWRQLGIAEGRQGNIGEAEYALAEAAMQSGRWTDALRHATRADQALAAGSPTWLRVQDILSAAESEVRRSRTRGGQ